MLKLKMWSNLGFFTSVDPGEKWHRSVDCSL